jgi:hypothetical protein
MHLTLEQESARGWEWGVCLMHPFILAHVEAFNDDIYVYSPPRWFLSLYQCWGSGSGGLACFSGLRYSDPLVIGKDPDPDPSLF